MFSIKILFNLSVSLLFFFDKLNEYIYSIVFSKNFLNLFVETLFFLVFYFIRQVSHFLFKVLIHFLFHFLQFAHFSQASHNVTDVLFVLLHFLCIFHEQILLFFNLNSIFEFLHFFLVSFSIF